MFKHKEDHGSGENLEFLGSEEIEVNMQGHPSEYKVNIYGDGSYTSPTVWWAALGGFGIWVLKWNASIEQSTAETGHNQLHKQQPPHLPQL